MVERFRAVRQFFHEEGELVTYEDYKALADKLDRLTNDKLRPLKCVPHSWSSEEECPFCNAEELRGALLGLQDSLHERTFELMQRHGIAYDARFVLAFTELCGIRVVERQTHEYEHTCTLTPDVPCAACGYLDRAERL